MSRDNLGNKQTIIIHNCSINDKKNDRVITPHRKTIGYIRTKRQTLRKKIINNEKQNIKKLFSKRRNASTKNGIKKVTQIKQNGCPLMLDTILSTKK